ncbi:MAG TPA: sigma factor-like helix-turn-helix DNA-binding protein [Thermoanaerobaculia bacterium]|jgi:DNA-directed RNA polymerase specialized sigma24 family protein|nr:sigma factor-like helix-turn-helix DNA-binding protein [Thermoanaerobaculia bacterium]
MSISGKEAVGLRHSADAEEIDRLYQSLSGVLFGVLTERYGLTVPDAEFVIEDTFSAYMTSKAAVSDAQGWLISTVCEEAETLQQIRAFEEALPEASRDTRDRELTRRALATLPENAREAVRLKFHERKSYDDIAATLDVAVHYAERLVATSVTKVAALRRRFRRRE